MKVTIQEKPKQAVDIFRKGNYVIDRGLVVLITEARTGDKTFSGVAVKADSVWSGGELFGEWSKACFTQFHGTITIDL